MFRNSHLMQRSLTVGSPSQRSWWLHKIQQRPHWRTRRSCHAVVWIWSSLPTQHAIFSFSSAETYFSFSPTHRRYQLLSNKQNPILINNTRNDLLPLFALSVFCCAPSIHRPCSEFNLSHTTFFKQGRMGTRPSSTRHVDAGLELCRNNYHLHMVHFASQCACTEGWPLDEKVSQSQVDVHHNLISWIHLRKIVLWAEGCCRRYIWNAKVSTESALGGWIWIHVLAFISLFSSFLL